MDDVYKPYSLKFRRVLEDYLESHDGMSCDNHFCGARYFYVMQRKGLIIPRITSVRVATHVIPDTLYLVNEDFMLQSSGRGEGNMSCVGGDKGVYNPRVLLRRRHWSIHGLKLIS